MKSLKIEHYRTPTEKILDLLRRFPCLNKIFKHWNPKEFDPDEFYGFIGGMSHGEKLCARFILNVWNPSYARQQGWDFDVMEFAVIADEDAKAAFMDWLIQPLWP